MAPKQSQGFVLLCFKLATWGVGVGAGGGEGGEPRHAQDALRLRPQLSKPQGSL